MAATSKKRTVMLLILVIFILLLLFVLALFFQRVRLNDGPVTGNTAGNLNNGGLFCEKDGVVYFSNAYDGGRLYSMSPDETHMKKLTDVKATSINADSHYLYYYLDSSTTGTGLGFVQRTYGVYRSKQNGKSSECLYRGNAVTLQLCGNYLYYQYFDNKDKKGTQLAKVKIDKKEEKKVADYNINPASCVDGLIYFNGTRDDHYLYTLNTADDSIRLLWDGDIWNPVCENGYIYYMDVPHNYRLCRFSLADRTSEVLTEDRVDFFNVSGGMIYYQKSSRTDPALLRMSVDGGEPELVASGVFKNINITSSFVYFSGFDSDIPVYRTPVNGPVNVTQFDAAASAAADIR